MEGGEEVCIREKETSTILFDKTWHMGSACYSHNARFWYLRSKSSFCHNYSC